MSNSYISAGKAVPTASEAIVAADGRVKRLISNYETFVGDTFDRNVLPIPGKPINDAQHPDIPILIDCVDKQDDIKLPNINNQRVRIYIIAALVLFIFLWSSLSLFDSSSSTGITPAFSFSKTEFGLTTSNTQRLRNTMDLIVQDNKWSDQRINALISSWNKLDREARSKVIETPWYQLFSFYLEQQISDIKQSQTNPGKTSNAKGVLGLAATLGIADYKGNKTATSRYQELIQDLTQELAEAEKSSANSQDNDQESEKALNDRLKNQLSVYYPDNVTEEIATDQEKATLDSQLFTEHNITALLEQYKNAYEIGDLSKMLSLFDAGLLDKTRVENLKNKFLPVFNNTSKRSIYFHDTDWQVRNGEVVLNSGYNAVLELKNKKGTQNVSADAVVTINAVNNSLLISSIKLLNRKTNVVSSQLPPAVSSISKNPPSEEQDISRAPTPSQLQDITTQLVTAYETGDINQFSSLFAADVKTNDRLDLEGLKKDYQQLFNTTSDRQMFIQNLKWTTENIGAKGTGDLEVIILSDTGGTVYTMTGKIQIVAQLIGDDVLITRLYHIERQK